MSRIRKHVMKALAVSTMHATDDDDDDDNNNNNNNITVYM